MSAAYKRPKTLWSENSPPASVSEYIAYLGEFDTEWIGSDYPYRGKASDAFRRVTKLDYCDTEIRFADRGAGCWVLRRDHSLNCLTADLFAAADALGGKLETEDSSSLPGGIGADSSRIWTSLLDGGVGASVVLWEHQYTNRVHIQHKTTIRGPRAYRVLLELLGFDWSNRKLYGEVTRPTHGEIVEQTNTLLASGSGHGA